MDYGFETADGIRWEKIQYKIADGPKDKEGENLLNSKGGEIPTDAYAWRMIGHRVDSFGRFLGEEKMEWRYVGTEVVDKKEYLAKFPWGEKLPDEEVVVLKTPTGPARFVDQEAEIVTDRNIILGNVRPIWSSKKVIPKPLPEEDRNILEEVRARAGVDFIEGMVACYFFDKEAKIWRDSIAFYSEGVSEEISPKVVTLEDGVKLRKQSGKLVRIWQEEQIPEELLELGVLLFDRGIDQGLAVNEENLKLLEQEILELPWVASYQKGMQGEEPEEGGVELSF